MQRCRATTRVAFMELCTHFSSIVQRGRRFSCPCQITRQGLSRRPGNIGRNLSWHQFHTISPSFFQLFHIPTTMCFRSPLCRERTQQRLPPSTLLSLLPTLLKSFNLSQHSSYQLPGPRLCQCLSSTPCDQTFLYYIPATHPQLLRHLKGSRSLFHRSSQHFLYQSSQTLPRGQAVRTRRARTPPPPPTVL